jgi:transposase
MSKKSYNAQFKTNVAIEAIKGEKSYVEIASAHNIPKTNVKEWHDKLQDGAVNIFLGDSLTSKKIKSLEQDIDRLHKIIGELAVDNSFYKKKLMK